MYHPPLFVSLPTVNAWFAPAYLSCSRSIAIYIYIYIGYIYILYYIIININSSREPNIILLLFFFFPFFPFWEHSRLDSENTGGRGIMKRDLRYKGYRDAISFLEENSNASYGDSVTQRERHLLRLRSRLVSLTIPDCSRVCASFSTLPVHKYFFLYNNFSFFSFFLNFLNI